MDRYPDPELIEPLLFYILHRSNAFIYNLKRLQLSKLSSLMRHGVSSGHAMDAGRVPTG